MNQYAKRRHAIRSSGGDPDAVATGRWAAAPAESDASVEAVESALERDGGAASLDVDAALAGSRLDRFLFESLSMRGERLSRTRLKALVEAGAVEVNGEPVRDPALKVREGQTVRLVVAAAVAPQPVGESIPLNVVFEDAHLIVIDKPAGLVVHPAAGHDHGTLVNALITHCGASLSGIGGVKRPGIVHRLDKDTSGLMVIAKTDAAHRGLAELFADHGRTLGLIREYEALIWGAPMRPAGVVDAPLGRHPHNREKQAVTPGRGREATTHWRVEKLFPSMGPPRKNDEQPVAALIRCRLETGRTHQIRVHMASIGHPVMDDSLYGAGFKTRAGRLPEQARAALAALGRQALHARALGFRHPVSGEELFFESRPPAPMQALVDALTRGL
jgi:23S rRNA pseudouridine1911/1915/1917 synthase